MQGRRTSSRLSSRASTSLRGVRLPSRGRGTNPRTRGSGLARGRRTDHEQDDNEDDEFEEDENEDEEKDRKSRRRSRADAEGDLSTGIDTQNSAFLPIPHTPLNDVEPTLESNVSAAQPLYDGDTVNVAHIPKHFKVYAPLPRPSGHSGARGILKGSRPPKMRTLEQLLQLDQQRRKILGREEFVNWTGVAAGPTLRPAPALCDITGLPSNYKDPTTGLRYLNKEIYSYLRTMSRQQIECYSVIRHKSSTVKPLF